MKWTGIWVVLPSFLFLLSSVGVSWAGPPELDGIEMRLRAAVEEAQKKFPSMEPWQKDLFNAEVVTQFQRFIRNYQQTRDSVQVEVDYDSIKRYLAFYGPSSLRQAAPQVVVLLRADPACTKCTQSSPEIEKLVRSRLEKRGLTPIWLKADEFGPHLTGNSLADRVARIEKERGVAGYLVVEWAPAPVDSIDTAHADEERYFIRVFLKMGDLSKQIREKEVFDTDSFEVSLSRLLTDILTDLGAKLEWEQATQNEGGREEILIEISGIRDFEQYMRIKTVLTTQLKDVSSLVERKFSRGRIIFAVYSNRRKDELRTQLNELSLDPQSPHSLTIHIP